MKYSHIISFFLATLSLVLIIVFFTPEVSAQQPVCPNGTGRAIQMMVGIPGLPPDGCARTLPEYINDFYLFLITIGAIVGVVKIALAGFKYATSEIVSSKSAAKRDIQGVFLGLIILLIPFLVLNTISPNAAKLDVLKLDRIGGTEGTGSFNAAQQPVTQGNPTQIQEEYPKECFSCIIGQVQDCYTKIRTACVNGAATFDPNNGKKQICRVRADAVCPPAPEGLVTPRP